MGSAIGREKTSSPEVECQHSTSTGEVERQLACEIGARISQIRGNLSQKEFARLIGRNFNNVNKYERGLNTPGSGVVNDICAKFNINHEWLLTGNGPMRKGEEIPEGAARMEKSVESDQPAIDPEALEAIIQILDDVQAEYRLRFSAQKKAQIILAAWDLWLSIPEESRSMETLGKLIKSAA